MEFYLQVTEGPFGLQGREMLLPDRPICIGRADSVELSIPTSTVSRVHAMLQPVGDGYLLADLESSNGTFVAGQRVKEARLADGDDFRVGEVTIQLRLRPPAEASYAASAAETAMYPTVKAEDFAVEDPPAQDVDGSCPSQSFRCRSKLTVCDQLLSRLHHTVSLLSPPINCTAKPGGVSVISAGALQYFLAAGQ